MQIRDRGNSSFDVGDDAICLKSGKNEAGRLLGKLSERISIRNCTVYHGHGGIVVGSEMSGGIRMYTYPIAPSSAPISAFVLKAAAVAAAWSKHLH